MVTLHRFVMNRARKFLTSVTLSLLMMLIFCVPVFAGTWTEHDDHTWTYLNDDGESVTGWINDNGKTYYLDKEGCKKTGWLKSKGCWYYFNENGEMASNTWIDNYYVNSDGKWKGTR